MAAHPLPRLRSPGNRSEALRIEVHRLLSFILRRSIGIEENPSRAAEPGWDSLKHVDLVFLVEDHFGLRFAEREIAELEDGRGLEELVELRLHARTVLEESHGVEEKGDDACATA